MYQNKNDLINVGFLLEMDQAWLGGAHYFINLFKAHEAIENKKTRLLLIPCGKGIGEFRFKIPPNVKIVDSKFFAHGNLAFLIRKILQKCLRIDLLGWLVLKSKKIDVISHVGEKVGLGWNCIGWIPDFQHKFLPNFFSNKEIQFRDKCFNSLILKCPKIIVSSQSSKNDALEMYYADPKKIEVLKFCTPYHRVDLKDVKEVLTKFEVSKPFVFLPNQFWKHKNHLNFFRALSFIKENELKNFEIICTGKLDEYKDPDYCVQIKKTLNNLKLEKILKIIGVVSQKELSVFTYSSLAIVNPSLFEGWSTTVEEAKTYNKKLLLSDIPVHREQLEGYKQFHLFFDPLNPENIANVLSTLFSSVQNREESSIVELEEFSTRKLREYGLNYENIICRYFNEG